jgi:CRISPR-associated protein Cmr3
MNENIWLIEPRDALIVRDGRPFGIGAGNRATSLDFPFPSTLTGAARTRAGLSTIGGELKNFNSKLGDDVQREISVSGALLAELENGKVKEFLVHAPADCAVFEVEENGKRKDEKCGKLIPLVPLEEEREDKYLSNLNNKNKHNENLHLLGLKRYEKSKPHKDAPRFWRWSEFEKWLLEPKIEKRKLAEIGIGSLPKDRRTHVEMNYTTKAGKDGGLFETRGLEFARKEVDEEENIQFKKYGLVLQVDYGNFGGKIEEGIAPLGGERRLVSWREIKETEKTFPDCPPKIKTKIVAEKHCRLVLLTPAIFENGFLPEWLKTDDGLNVEIRAVAVNRYQVISGYDFKIGKPKPTRRMCPAGTVFFLRLNGDKSAIENWIDKTWFSCVSDLEQNRKDGFGLAALGAWNGEFLKIEEALKNESD